MYLGKRFAISAWEVLFGDGTATVQSDGDVIDHYRVHPEAKSLGPDGMPCGKRAIGLLGRRPVTLGELVHIGKESNRLEEVEQGLVHDWDDVQLVLREPRAHWKVLTAQDDAQPAVQRVCRVCGGTLGSGRKVYCSPACRQRAYRHRSGKRGKNARVEASVSW